MKIVGIAVGLAALLTAGSASAALVYDTLTGQTPVAGYKPMPTANRGPLGDSFVVSGSEWISSVTLELKDATPTDGGSTLVYLVPNNASGIPTIPSSTGVTLTGVHLLGTILDSSMTTTYSNMMVSAGLTLAPGSYWIELVDGNSAANGNGNTAATNAQWAYNLDTGGLGVPLSGDFSSYANASNNGLTGPALSNSPGFIGDPIVFEMQVQTPEPASMAVLGAGLIGLGFSRRRRSKKPTT
jgi:hypothetical protein